LTKLPLSFVTNDPKAKDRGKHSTYEEMIQTWVTYEVVKVLYLFGLNPSHRSNLEEIAPEIEKYIKYIESNKFDEDNEDEDDEDEEHEDIKNTHEIIFKRAHHSGLFEKCTFASWTEVKWKEDVKYMIPFLLLTWLRQLEQYFKKKNNKHCTWAEHGNYQPHISFSKGESSNPLGVVYLFKPGTEKAYKVGSYNDIKPYEPKTLENVTNVLIPSFEEWAMLLLTLPNHTRLKETMRYDEDTRRRMKMAELKIKQGYKFELNDKNYANKEKNKDEKNKNNELEPILDYNNKTQEEIHADINNGFIKGHKAIEKIKAKKTKSTEDNVIIDNMENMIRAYIALASKTFSSTYSTLKDIQIDLDRKIAQQQSQHKEKSIQAGDKPEIESSD
jgi:hypothetical protein